MNEAKKLARILVVDDEERNRRLLVAMLEAEGYSASEAADGMQALELARQSPPDLILLDIMMPGMDGYEVARQLKAAEATCSVPVVMVTALDDRESRLRGLEAGAEEFVSKPVDRNELRVRVRNLLRLKEFSDFLANHNRILETQVNERTRQLTASYRETITTMTRAASYKDEETGAHVARVSFYSAELAQALGMGAAFCDVIHYASPMHDVGKIAISDAILGKPGQFEPHEWEIMKTHAALGAKMLGGTDSPYLVMGAEIAGGHHERWDGGGYPLGLRGEAIPLPARIMQICDVYDALRSRRPYKEAFSHERSTEIIITGDGRTEPSHFDPAVFEAFQRSTARFCDIFEAHRDGG
ncbi:MAG: two-component system response regulator [Betaproteobacteria bacterium HGW-Betaproteobacteria-18]|nr:MAG: two-component system response regulator [Betaproteobacteria bacterium HGW-Betaproteobacteria-18]